MDIYNKTFGGKLYYVRSLDKINQMEDNRTHIRG